MSQQREPAIQLSGRSVGAVLSGSIPALTDHALRAIVEEIDVYGALPPELLSGDITAVVQRNLRMFVDALGEGRPPSADDLTEIRLSAARRAEERIPLDLMLRAYPLAAKAIFEFVTAEAGPEDADALRTLTALLLDFLKVIMSAATAGYLEEHQMIIGAAQSHEERVFEALLRGGPDLATDLGSAAELPAAFDVLAIHLAAHPDELEPGVDAAIAARRKLRRSRAELRRRTNEGVLLSLQPDGGVALVPVDDAATARGGGERAADIDALQAAAGVPVTAAVVRTIPSGVAGAVSEAKEVLDLVRHLGRGAGLYRLDDVLVEYQISRPGPAQRALAARLAPISGEPDLLLTLDRYLINGGNRRRTALDLHIHPNTVDYRIAKVGRLVGLDPTTADGAYQLRAALTALRAGRDSAAAGAWMATP